MENPWRKGSKVNPQVENGYRRYANELWARLMKLDITGADFRVLMAILDKTWGFGKKEDSISISQFVKMTELSDRQIRRSQAKLKMMRVIHYTLTGLSGVNCYLFNKHWDTWLPPPDKLVTPDKVGNYPPDRVVSHKRKNIQKKGNGVGKERKSNEIFIDPILRKVKPAPAGEKPEADHD